MVNSWTWALMNPSASTSRKPSAKGRARLDGIEAFWSFTKRRLTRFDGVKVNFLLHLRECEWRGNKPAPSSATNL